jgi:hypothetical protein
MDDNEDFHFRSATSTVHFSTTTVDKLSVVIDLSVVEYPPAASWSPFLLHSSPPQLLTLQAKRSSCINVRAMLP